MTAFHTLPHPTPSRPAPPLAPGRTDVRDFGVMLVSVFLLGAGAVTAAILYESGEHGAGAILAGPVLALVAFTPLWALYRKRQRRAAEHLILNKSLTRGPA